MDGKVELRFQDAGASDDRLLTALLECCQHASRGGGIFAWTNASGTKSFFDDKIFVQFMATGEFELVIGMDSITDERAVTMLTRFDDRWDRLSIRAFLHEEHVLFHPKLAWFENDDEITLIVGSGNLTMGGLKNNWEAYTISRLHGTSAENALNEIHAWLARSEKNLLHISDPSVLRRAKENIGDERSLKRAPRKSNEYDNDDAVKNNAQDVLVAEIPRSTGRGSQANFDKQNYETFFGAMAGQQSRISLYRVGRGGDLGEVESRPSVESTSKNYRFELSALKNVPYPDDGPPIAVFVRVRTSDFIYVLLLPSDVHYEIISAFLTDMWSGPSNRKRRLRTTVNHLRNVWSNSPLWDVRLPDL